MTDYADRLRKFNRAGQVQYEWFEEVADYIEKLKLEVEALESDRTASWEDGYEAGKKAAQNKGEPHGDDTRSQS
jgi:outer membrane murein-binding lipoprotein Lpp